MKQSDQVPVILHIPKNAGTYISYMSQQFFVRNWRDKRSRESDIMNIRRFTLRDQTVEMDVFCVMNDDYFLKDSHVQNCFDETDPTSSRCSIDTFKMYLANGNATILMILVNPSTTKDLRVSWFSAWNLLKSIKVSPINHMFLRDTFSRQQSLYYYITSDISSHDLTHDKIKCGTFEQYITSDQLEDSWLIRGITNMPDNLIIDQQWFDLAINFIREYNIQTADINDIDNVLDQLFKTLFNKSFIDLVRLCNATRPPSEIVKETNRNKYSKISLADLSEDIRKIYNDRTRWDYELYNTLIRK